MKQTLQDVVLRLAQQELADGHVVARDELPAIDSAAPAPVVDETRREEASGTAARSQKEHGAARRDDERVQIDRAPGAEPRPSGSGARAPLSGEDDSSVDGSNIDHTLHKAIDDESPLATRASFVAISQPDEHPDEVPPESDNVKFAMPQPSERGNSTPLSDGRGSVGQRFLNIAGNQATDIFSPLFADTAQPNEADGLPYSIPPSQDDISDAPYKPPLNSKAEDSSTANSRAARQMQDSLDEHGRQFEQIMGELEAALARLFGTQIDILTRLREQADEHERRWVEHGAARRASF